MAATGVVTMYHIEKAQAGPVDASFVFQILQEVVSPARPVNAGEAQQNRGKFPVAESSQQRLLRFRWSTSPISCPWVALGLVSP